jgi:hypothetical protein
LLARYTSRSSSAALVAGAIVLCSPERLDELRLGQLPTISDYFLPLALLLTLITLERRRWNMAIWVGVTILLAGMNSWYHILHVTLMLLTIFLWRMVAAWKKDGRSGVKYELIPWLWVIGWSIVVALPLGIPVAIEAAISPYARKSDNLIFYVDLLRMLPSSIGAIWSPVPINWQYQYVFAALPLVLALLSMVLLRRKTWLWAVVAAVCVIFSLGPRLYVGGVDTGVPLPYALIRSIPVFDVLRAPQRLNLISTLMIATIASLGLAERAKRFAPAARGVGALAMIALLVVESVRLPFPLLEIPLSPAYHIVASTPGEWSIIELPLDRFDGAEFQMYSQAFHGKKILTGYLARDVPRLPYESAPPIAQADQGETAPDIVSLSAEAKIQLLQSLRIRYLLIHTEDSTSGKRAQRELSAASQILGPLTEVYGDADIRMLQLDTVAAWLDGVGAAVTVETPLFLGLDEQWDTIERRGDDIKRWLPLHGAGFWTFTQRPRQVTLNLDLFSIAGARPLEIWLNGRHLENLSILPGLETRTYRSKPFTIPRGSSKIELRAPEGGVSPKQLGISNDTRLLSFGIRHAEIVELTK